MINQFSSFGYSRQLPKAVRLFAATVWLLIAAVVPLFGYTPQFADSAGQVRLRWRSGGKVSLALSNSLRQPAANVKAGSDVTKAVEQSLARWERAANIRFTTVWTDESSISQLGKGNGTSLITIAGTPENLAAFGAAPEAAELAAATRIFYTARGTITEADIVLNPYQQFSTDGSFGTYDLEAALTHEIGHLLGLDHSPVRGATMYAHTGRNGTFSLAATAQRTLAEDDRAGVRSLYDARADDTDCCAAILGKLTVPKDFTNVIVWVEEVASGRLVAGNALGENNLFVVAGLRPGSYRLFATGSRQKAAVQELGTAAVKAGETKVINRRLNPTQSFWQPVMIGFNGQLSTLAVPVNAGRSYLLYIGGELSNLSAGSFAFTSPHLTVNPTNLTQQDFGAEIDVYSFETTIGPNAPHGEYSLRFTAPNGKQGYLPGCVTIDEVENNWQNRVLIGGE